MKGSHRPTRGFARLACCAAALVALSGCGRDAEEAAEEERPADEQPAPPPPHTPPPVPPETPPPPPPPGPTEEAPPPAPTGDTGGSTTGSMFHLANAIGAVVFGPNGEVTVIDANGQPVQPCELPSAGGDAAGSVARPDVQAQIDPRYARENPRAAAPGQAAGSPEWTPTEPGATPPSESPPDEPAQTASTSCASVTNTAITGIASVAAVRHTGSDCLLLQTISAGNVVNAPGLFQLPPGCRP